MGNQGERKDQQPAGEDAKDRNKGDKRTSEWPGQGRLCIAENDHAKRDNNKGGKGSDIDKLGNCGQWEKAGEEGGYRANKDGHFYRGPVNGMDLSEESGEQTVT